MKWAVLIHHSIITQTNIYTKPRNQKSRTDRYNEHAEAEMKSDGKLNEDLGRKDLHIWGREERNW